MSRLVTVPILAALWLPNVVIMTALCLVMAAVCVVVELSGVVGCIPDRKGSI